MRAHINYIIAAIALALLLAAAPRAAAQESRYRFDFGASLGMTGYLGDANRASLLKHPGFSGEIGARYIKDARWAFRATLGALTLKGSTADMDDVLPDLATYKFSSTVVDFGVRAEFNFLPYGIGETYKGLKRISPYVTLGFGCSIATCSGNIAAAPSIPIGLGVKFKAAPRLNLIAEFTMTKTLSDKMDGDKLHDLNQIKTNFIKDTDWYSRLTIGFTYEFGERCQTCNYVD